MLTDPPFFMPATHYQSRVKWQRTWGDTSILATFWDAILEVAVPRLKESGHALVFCNHESYPVFYPQMYGRFDFLKSLVWDKGHVGLGRIWRNQHEFIIAARWNESEFNEDGKLRSDVLSFKATRSAERLHPVEKPHDLLADLITPTVPDGGSLFDPFMGGGSSLVAAKKLGRRCVGIDNEERYCEIAAKRLEQGVLPFPDDTPQPHKQTAFA